MVSVVEKYFSILDDYFGEVHKALMSKGGRTKENTKAIVKYFYGEPNENSLVLAESTLDTLFEELIQLNWDSQNASIRETGGLKVSYFGSEFGFEIPLNSAVFLKKVGLYADTVIINESLLLTLTNWKKGWWYSKVALPSIIQMASDLLSMKELFDSDSNPPVCSLISSSLLTSHKAKNLETYKELVDNETVAFASEYFGRVFNSYVELKKFLSKIKIEDFLKLSKNPALLAKDDGSPITYDNIEKTIKKMDETSNQSFPLELKLLSILEIKYGTIISSLMQTGKFHPCFATDNKGYWRNLLWLMRHDNTEMMKCLHRNNLVKDAGIINALQQKDLNWLGNVPLSGIKKLRERGEMGDIRELIGKNVQEIEDASDEDFAEVGLQVKYNIDQALKKHSILVKDLSQKYNRMIGLGTAGAASLVVSGTLGFVASAYPPLALASGINSWSTLIDSNLQRISKLARQK